MIDYDSMNEPGIYPSVKGKMGKLSNKDLRVIYYKKICLSVNSEN